PFFSATGASGAAGGAGEVSMDSPGTSTPRGVMRTFLDDRPHVPQYAKLSPITIHTHLISEFLAGAWAGATTGDGACEDSRGGCHTGACDTGLPSGGTNPGLPIAPESNFAFCASARPRRLAPGNRITHRASIGTGSPKN